MHFLHIVPLEIKGGSWALPPPTHTFRPSPPPYAGAHRLKHVPLLQQVKDTPAGKGDTHDAAAAAEVCDPSPADMNGTLIT